MFSKRCVPVTAVMWACVLISGAGISELRPAQAADEALKQVGVQRGVCAVLGLPNGDEAACVTDLARNSQLLVYFQSPNAEEVAAVRKSAAAAGLLSKSVFVDRGDWSRIHLADNLADAVLVLASAEQSVSQQEVLRVLHPQGKAVMAGREIVKPAAQGVDWWGHPYHGPDNNPQSTDQRARAPYLTQFLAEPDFCPMPEVSVAAAGRVYRAFGHIAHKANQNAMLNTLICANAYNGTILWTRPLAEGFMIHRNTMIATADTLYLADHRSCKLIDPASGNVREEIVVPDGVSDGPVWKWMALVDGVLYALVGAQEAPITTQPSQTPGLGHWPWGMWEGHDYKAPKTSFGFGRTFLAVDMKSKGVLWTHREDDYADSRGVCMRNGRIYFYSPNKFLGCLDARNGNPIWKNADADLLAAIGSSGRAQHYITGYATTTFIKCNDDYIFFAGPQRERLVVARTQDGKLVWQKEHGNFQLVLREDGVYAAGPQQGGDANSVTGYKLAYADGAVLAELPMRRACTRATGSVDSIFFRASGGTVRIDTVANQANHIAPMRPPCQDGVLISDGNLYWGPWMCGCQLSLYGHICLTSAGDFDFRPGLDSSRLEKFDVDQAVTPLEVRSGDWPAYQGDCGRSSKTTASIPFRVKHAWTYSLRDGDFPTAPVTAGGYVFFGDRTGVVRAVRADSGELAWEAYTGGAIYFPPAIDGGRLFVGSADGRVYAFEASTGRPLWTFRAAPAERIIPVYGRLISTWPVSGGVVVHDGAVYAAAGIAHYDGTHVYSLDAATGMVKWYNDTSGAISRKMNSGVSLQGELYIRDGELRFAGGGVHEEARYDLATGKCLNEPHDVPNSSFHTAFYAYYPGYGKYVSLDCPLADGRSLCYDATYEGSWHGSLMLLPTEAPQQRKPISRWGAQWRRGQKPNGIWEQPGRRFNSFVVAGETLLAAGHAGTEDAENSFLAAVNVNDGKDRWFVRLPGPVVKGGTAVDHQGNIYIALENNGIAAFASAE